MAEEDVFAELEERRRRQAEFRARATPEAAQLVGANRATFNHLAPGDALGLAKAGQGPDSPVARKVAQARAKRKAKRGFGLHSIGDVVTGAAGKVRGAVDFVVPDAVVDVAGSAIGEASQVAKPIVRTALTGLMAGGEELQGIARGAIAQVDEQGFAAALNPFSSQTMEYWDKAGPSTARLAAARLLKGERVRLGAGFLPGMRPDDPKTPENEEQLGATQQRLARRLQRNGEWISIGRTVADVVTEPGTKPYDLLSGLVDMGVAIGLDPAARGLGRAATVRKVNRSFAPEKVGLITGVRKTVDTDTAAEWLASEPGRKVTAALAEDSDFHSIYTRLGRKVEPAVALELEKADTPQAVAEILHREVLGGRLREKPKVGGVPFENPVVRRVVDARIWQGLPNRSLDYGDPHAAVQTMENFLRNANIRDPKVIAYHTREAAKATLPDASGGDRLDAITAAAKVVEDVIVDRLNRNIINQPLRDPQGIKAATNAERAREMTTLFLNQQESLKGWNKSDIGENVWFPGAKVKGDNVVVASPHLVIEGLNNKVPLPDIRDIRLATSRFGHLLSNPLIDTPALTLDFLQQTIWKPMVLIRGAWTLRVVGEEQLRMAGAGFTSFANHPISAIAWAVGQDSRTGKALGALGVKTGRAANDILDHPFADANKIAPEPTAYEQGMYKGKVSDPIRRAGAIRVRDRIMYDKDAREYNIARANEMLRLRADPIGRRIAQGGLERGDRVPSERTGIEGIKDWFWEGNGRGIRADVVKQAREPRTAPVTRELSDLYVQTVVDRLARVTGNDDELVRAVATGVFNDRYRTIPLRDGDYVNNEFEKVLRKKKDTGPAQVVGDRVIDVNDKGNVVGERWKSGVNSMFGFLMARPSNWLSRSPVFRQAYYERTAELVAHMAPEARAAAIAAARKNKLPAETIERMESLAKARPGELTLVEADALAKGHALETVRDLLYDLSQKGQFADQLRLISPFAEAWKEVLTRWARIGMENTAIIRRGQQVVTGARGAGWFQPDPTTGEEMMTLPGFGFLTEKAIGVRVPFKMRVAGLSLATSFIPGVGPVVQYPASQLIPNRPEWDGIRKALLPFGDPDTEGGLLESLAPAWFQKWRIAFARNDPEQDRMFGNTVHDMARYLVSTGEYSMDTPDEMERTLTEATTKAKALYVLRGAAQFFAPSAPSPQFLAKDRNGDFLVATKLIEDFRKMQDDDYDTAVERFIDKYGEDALLFMQPKTTGTAPSTTELGKWAREHPSQVKRFSTVYGFFGPQGDEFDFDFYQRQLRSGERKPISPAEGAKLANARVAQMIYRKSKANVEGRTDSAAKQYLAQVRDQLLANYPGYEPMPKDLGKTDRTIREIQRAVKDPVMAGTEAGKGIAAYLEAREQALEAAKRDLELTSGFGRAKKARYLRDYMREVGAAVTKEYPAFSTVFEQVFEREMVDDTDEEAPAA